MIGTDEFSKADKFNVEAAGFIAAAQYIQTKQQFVTLYNVKTLISNFAQLFSYFENIPSEQFHEVKPELVFFAQIENRKLKIIHQTLIQK